MIIELRNFGPIKNIKIDLNKDLHLIYGENAIGKSYVTYFIYCLIKNIKNKAILNPYYWSDNAAESPYTEFIRGRLKLLKLNKPNECTREFISLIEKDLQKIILKGLENSLLNTFSSLKNLKNRYTNKNYSIIIHISQGEKINIFSKSNGTLSIKYENDLKHLELIHKDTKSTKYTLNINGKKAFGSPNEEEFINRFLHFSLLKTNEILRRLDFNIRDIYYLPASRSGLYQALNAFTPIIAELTQNRFFIQNKSIELPSLSEPLADYFIDLSTVDVKNVNKEFLGIIKILQNEVLKGDVEYNDKTKRILYKPKGIDLELNLSEASSMVAELSPLVLYFKHILNNKYSSTKGNRGYFFFDRYYSEISRNQRKNQPKGYDILFIEEPEAHLHPEVQVKLTELFAQLPKLNLKLFITSHSNYMFNKFNNLLIKNEIVQDTLAVYHLVKDSDGSTKNGGMKISEDGINDENFQDISEQLYFERFNFLDSQNDK